MRWTYILLCWCCMGERYERIQEPCTELNHLASLCRRCARHRFANNRRCPLNYHCYTFISSLPLSLSLSLSFSLSLPHPDLPTVCRDERNICDRISKNFADYPRNEEEWVSRPAIKNKRKDHWLSSARTPMFANVQLDHRKSHLTSPNSFHFYRIFLCPLSSEYFHSFQLSVLSARSSWSFSVPLRLTESISYLFIYLVFLIFLCIRSSIHISLLCSKQRVGIYRVIQKRVWTTLKRR